MSIHEFLFPLNSKLGLKWRRKSDFVWNVNLCTKVGYIREMCEWLVTINSLALGRSECDSNKANLRDLMAATGLLILLKLDLNRRFISPCDLEIWWMTQKNNGAPLLCYFKLFASFRSDWWMQTRVTVRKRLIWVKINAFLSRVTLKFDRWPSKTIGHLFYATSSFVQHFVAIGVFKLELESGNTQSGSNAALFRAVWPWNLTDDLEKQ